MILKIKGWIHIWSFYKLNIIRIHYHMIKTIKPLLIITTLLALGFSMKMTILLNGLEKHCFYEILCTFLCLFRGQSKIFRCPQVPQKLRNLNEPHGRWSMVNCILQSHRNILPVPQRPQTRLSLLNLLHLLEKRWKLTNKTQRWRPVWSWTPRIWTSPRQIDSENLNRELNCLQNQKRNMFSILERMESLRASTEGLTELMSVKMIGFAIIGLLSIIMVNFMFYRELKKTFKERKLIWWKEKEKVHLNLICLNMILLFFKTGKWG